MRVLVDTNVLLSAAYSLGGVPYRAFVRATEPPNTCLVCEQSLDEFRRVFKRKFPDRVASFEHFAAAMVSACELVPIPTLPSDDEGKVRDPDDRPILRAAKKAGADIIVTGDKDFLESGIVKPRIMTAAEFLCI